MLGDLAYDTVRTALRIGYRHIDTAQAYDNERAIGRAIADSEVSREDVFLTTKVDASNRSRAAILKSVEASLAALDVEAVDLLLIHRPDPFVETRTVMETFREIQERGWTHAIGVSNFGVDALESAREYASVPIAANQVLCHPFHPQRELVEYCQTTDVTLIAYSPLAGGALTDDAVCRDIGTRYDATATQVALRWVTQQPNVVAIPRSTTPDHLRANLDSSRFRLTDAEHQRITRPSIVRTGLATVRSRLRDAAVYYARKYLTVRPER